MRTTLIAATSVSLLLVAVAFNSLRAQPAPANRGGSPSAFAHGIAVIDIAYIMDKYSRLKSSQDQFNANVQAEGKKFQTRKETLGKSVEKLKGLKAGTPEYKALEAEIAQKDSELRVDVSLKEKEFQEKQSKNFLAAYQEITAATRQYMDSNGIQLVLRFNGNEPDPNNPEAVRAEVFKTVMHYDPSIDITPHILKMLERNAATANQRGGGPAQPNRK